jgi:hypothetical protein
MVDRIDRPEAKPAYEIREPKQAKEDQHHQPDQREQAEKQYRKQLEGAKTEWTKFGRKSMVIRPMKVPTERIASIVFKNINLYQGIGILQADIMWKDGRKTADVLIRIGRMEDYIRLRRLKEGSPVPPEFWSGSPSLEVGILQSLGTSGPMPMRDEREEPTEKARGPKKGILETIGVLNAATGKPNWGIIVFYLFIASIVAVGIYVELS